MQVIKFANVILQNESGEILVLRRTKDHPNRGLMPDLPGGTLEDGETYKQAAVRETFEETGINVGEKMLKLVFEKKVSSPNRPVSGKIYMVSVEKNQIDIILSWEHDQYRWSRPSNLIGFSYFHQEAFNYIFD